MDIFGSNIYQFSFNNNFAPVNFGNYPGFNSLPPLFQFNIANYALPMQSFNGLNSVWNNVMQFSLPAWSCPSLFSFTSKPATTQTLSSNKSTNSAANTVRTPMSGDSKEIGAQLYSKCKGIAQKRGLTVEFFERVAQIAKKINCDPMALLAKMYASSSLRTDAVNKSSGAVGLSQLLPSSKYVKMVGGTEKFKTLSALQQLDYIERYFIEHTKQFGGRYLEGEDIFAINFLPAYATRDVLVRRGEKYYEEVRDRDGDGDIDKADLRRTYQEKLNKMLNC